MPRSTNLGENPDKRAPIHRHPLLGEEPLSGDLALRATGIPVMSDVPWGSHLCIFYETKEDLLETVATYFAEGLRNKEFCLWAFLDPVTEAEAKDALRAEIADFDDLMAAGQIEIVDARDWYVPRGRFDLPKILGRWREKLDYALNNGYAGMRVSGDALWRKTKHWKDFYEYEHTLDRSVGEQKMIVLCTYAIQTVTGADILDVARAHQFTTARRSGHWDFLETPELKQAKREIRKLNSALDILSRSSNGQDPLTGRERVMLAQIVRGASSKEAARTLGVSPRTVEFHRANVMRKLGAKNIADLVRRVLGDEH